MKRQASILAATVVALSICIPASLHAAVGRGGGDGNTDNVKVLIIGLPDNVGSNYFSNNMITEDTGIPADSIDYAYNGMIAEGIVSIAEGKRCGFVTLPATSEQGLVDDVLSDIIISGESDEERFADIGGVDNEDYNQLLESADADYVLFLCQHYLKWQETPLRTLFHITSYSLYDREGHELLHGSNYFTTMDLEPQDRLIKDSRKCSSKIASLVAKSIAKK